jgi:hypothetical protein
VLARIAWIIDAEAASTRRLWLFFLDRNGIQSSVLVPIDDIPEFPDSQLVGNVCYIVSQVMSDDEPGASAVITLSRPGPAVVSEMDLNWLRALRRGAKKHQTSIRMFCLATPDGVLELRPARR